MEGLGIADGSEMPWGVADRFVCRFCYDSWGENGVLVGAFVNRTTNVRGPSDKASYATAL